MGGWDKAVALATGTGEDSANTIFNTFDVRLAETLDQASQQAADGLSEPQPGLTIAAVLALLGGLAAALLGRYGVAVRLGSIDEPPPPDHPLAATLSLRRRAPDPVGLFLVRLHPDRAAQPDHHPQPRRRGQPLPRRSARTPRRPTPRSATCRRPATCRPARPWRRSRSAAGWWPGCPPTPTCWAPEPADRPDRGLRHRPGEGRRQGDLRRREPLPAAGDHGRPADPDAAGRRGRPGRPQHDHHLRPLDPDRLLQRVLPLGTEDPGPQGLERHLAGRPGRSRCARRGHVLAGEP